MEKLKAFEEEEVLEDDDKQAPLQGRRSRQHGHITTRATTVTATTTNAMQYFDGKSLDTSNEGTETFKKEYDGKLESEIWLDKRNRETENLADESSLPVQTSAERLKLVEKIALPRAASSNVFDLPETGTISHNIQEIKADATEIYLEEVFKKPDTREFYCPKCQACIKKVILRDAEPKIRPTPHPDQAEELRCTYCFSFLIPADCWPFSIWVPPSAGNPGDIIDEPETKIIDPLHDPLGNKDQSNETLLQQHPGVPTGKPLDQIDLASATDETSPPLASVGGYPTSETPGTQEPGIVSVDAPKPDPEQLVKVVVDGGTASAHVTQEQDTEISQSTQTAGASTETMTADGSRGDIKVEILKSIVFGGLTESITSLSVVSSAASAGATTLNIVALAIANLIGGLFILGHNIWDLKSERPRKATSDQGNEQVDRYQELLGQKKNFILHAAIAVLSYLAFGLVPPVVYGFSFNDNKKDFKLLAVAAASLACIVVLATGKAHIRNPPPDCCGYMTTVMNHVFIGFMASGISYAAGALIKDALEKFGWLKSGFQVVVDPSLAVADSSLWKPTWASY